MTNIHGYISPLDTRVLGESRMRIVSPHALASTVSLSPKSLTRSYIENAVVVPSQPVSSGGYAPVAVSRRPPAISDYERDFKDYEDMQSKLDSIFGPTPDKQLVEKEHAKLERHRARARRKIHGIWEKGVYEPVMKNVTAQLEHKLVPPVKNELYHSSSFTNSIAATRLYSSRRMDSLDEELLLKFHGIPSTAPKLRGTVDPSKWREHAEISISEAVRRNVAPKTTSTVHFDDFGVRPAYAGRDASVDAEFPRGRKTFPVRSDGASYWGTAS